MLGGQVTVRRDRYGEWYVGVSAGVGVGGFALSVEQGNLAQDYAPDPGQIKSAVGGWGLSAQGAYGGQGVGVSVVNAGPTPYEYGLSSFGGALSIGYTWQLGK